MKYINCFKPIKKKGPIEYSDKIMEAVLNPRINNLCINMNGGWDWIDTKYKFIMLLLMRGQIKSIKSGQDLLARIDYTESLLSTGLPVNVILEFRLNLKTKTSAYASEKRINNANNTLVKELT